ncbi:hypothetical protein ABOM_000276 [Aspergillus bombycis]|uniref:Sulfatase-modifying factor enzyme domain-containing protein n=1 Tax=Aspergillus bombycis TaxID=109264 RepID=A0A1F8AH06_9EURO|nr:hypothetical protein ABOM_000276 [Aspergillus bombycis]OGM51004.1 hypothetical protein ABOM_000276 [Aspergillus bombycis]
MSVEYPSPSVFAFPLKPEEYAPAPLPSLEEWKKLWAAWDLVTTKMIPASALMERPIPLRNPLLFYLGHIPAFEDIHLTRATGGNPTEPAIFHDFFQRGIDPDVDDPTKCHDHSQLPESWPTLEEILDYRERVNERITALYNDPDAMSNRTIKRALWIGFEHEGLHLETFLYLTVQSPSVLPPPGPTPDFEAMAKKAFSERVQNQWFGIPDQTFTIGFDDPESDEGPNRFFAWDNEREPYSVSVPEFEAQARPVCNEEYARYLFTTGKRTIPITWTQDPNASLAASGNATLNQLMSDNGDIALTQFIASLAIKTVYGPVPLAWALDWPLMASYNEVEGYAEWVEARIPSLHEVRSVHEYAEKQKAKRNPPCNNCSPRSQPDPEEIFVDLTGCNAGLQHFHPIAVTQNGNRISGLGDMGGAWEWTSSVFAPQPNFKPMDIYPGYSADFMHGKHKAVVGGSWATHPRITGRKCFLNWWQMNYLYPWVAVRLVRDTVKAR